MPIDRANKSYIVRIVQQEKLQGFPYIMLPGKYAVRKAKRLWEEPKLWSNPSRNAGLNHPKHRSCDSARSGTFGWPDMTSHNHPSSSCRRAGAVFLVIPEDWHMQLVGESTNEIRWTQQIWPDMAWWCVVHNTEIRNARVAPGGKACLAENWLVLSGAFWCFHIYNLLKTTVGSSVGWTGWTKELLETTKQKMHHIYLLYISISSWDDLMANMFPRMKSKLPLADHS